MPAGKIYKAKTQVDKKQNKEITRLKQQLKPELKYWDYDSGVFQFDDLSTTAAGIHQIFGPALGDASYQRNGNVVAIRGIDIYGDIQSSAQAAAIFSRVALVLHQNPLGVALTNQQLIYGITNMTTGVPAYHLYGKNIMNQNINGLNSPAVQKGYKIIREKVFMQDGIGRYYDTVAMAAVDMLYNRNKFEIHIRYKKPLRVNYSGATVLLNGVAQQNQLYLCFASNAPSGGAGPTKPACSFRSRVTYTDI